jgi:hypothetical protein
MSVEWRPFQLLLGAKAIENLGPVAAIITGQPAYIVSCRYGQSASQSIFMQWLNSRCVSEGPNYAYFGVCSGWFQPIRTLDILDTLSAASENGASSIRLSDGSASESSTAYLRLVNPGC